MTRLALAAPPPLAHVAPANSLAEITAAHRRAHADARRGASSAGADHPIAAAPASVARRRLAVAAQLARIAVPAVVLVAWPALPTLGAAAAAVALYVGIFTLTHELAHGALGLSRRHNDLALAIAGVGMATSGHGLRLMHLRHHASPLSDGDLEGRSARMPAWRALLTAPVLSVLLVATAWRTATARDRRWQRTEYAALAGLAAVAFTVGPRALQLPLIVGLAAQLLAPFWAGHLPHRTPAWLLALARRLSRAGSMTMRTLVAHDAHHRHPKLPTYLLSDRA